MDTLRKVATQTSWQVIGKTATSLAALLLLGIITRSYGENGTGLFTLTLAYLNFFYFAADLGLNAHLLPWLEDNRDSIFRKLLGLRILLAVSLTGMALVLLPVLPFSGANFSLAVVIGSPAILFSAIFLTASLVFQKHLLYNRSAISLGVGALIAVLIGWVISYLRLPAVYLILAHVVDWIVSAILAMLFIKKFIPNPSPIFDRVFIRKTGLEVWMLSLTLLTSLVYFRIDTFILSVYYSLSEVGVYNVAYQLFQSALLGSTFIINSYYPLMVKALVLGRKAFFRQIIKACGLMLLLAIAGSLFTYLSAPWFIKILTGGLGFKGSVVALRILSFSFPLFFISSILMWTLITLKKYRVLIAIYLIGLLFNLLLNLYFIPQYSYIGAAWVTVVSEGLILILQVLILMLSL